MSLLCRRSSVFLITVQTPIIQKSLSKKCLYFNFQVSCVKRASVAGRWTPFPLPFQFYVWAWFLMHEMTSSTPLFSQSFGLVMYIHFRTGRLNFIWRDVLRRWLIYSYFSSLSSLLHPERSAKIQFSVTLTWRGL